MIIVIANALEEKVSPSSHISGLPFKITSKISKIRKLAVVKINVSSKKAAARLPTPAN